MKKKLSENTRITFNNKNGLDWVAADNPVVVKIILMQFRCSRKKFKAAWNSILQWTILPLFYRSCRDKNIRKVYVALDFTCTYSMIEKKRLAEYFYENSNLDAQSLELQKLPGLKRSL